MMVNASNSKIRITERNKNRLVLVYLTGFAGFLLQKNNILRTF